MGTKRIITLCILFLSCSAFAFLSIFVLQQQLYKRSHASSTTILSFKPESSFSNPYLININNPLDMDIMIDPGSNHISILKIEIAYDPKKFQTTGPNTLSIDTNTFPTIVEGPIINSNVGTIIATLSIGADPKRAITKPTRVGTLHLKGARVTNGDPESITFGTHSQAYSVAPNDHAYANVLATAKPAYITIGYVSQAVNTSTPVAQVSKNQSTQTPTPTKTSGTTPTVEIKPSAVMTQQPPLSVKPTLERAPTAAPKLSDAVVTINALLHGIGSAGDVQNPDESDFSNKDPQHTQRPVTVAFTNKETQKVSTYKAALLYDPVTGRFSGNLNTQNLLPSGIYTIKIKTDQYLWKNLPGSYVVGPGSRVSLPPVNMVNGDINGDNIQNILDYNNIIDCYGVNQQHQYCSGYKKLISDINDDAAVNESDYNLFIREIEAP